MTYRTLQELADLCGASLELCGAPLKGDAHARIRGAAALAEAAQDEISFYGHARYQRELAATHAGALVVPRGLAVARKDIALLRSDDANRAFECVLAAFERLPRRPTPGVHASAIVSPSASIAPSAAIGAHCVIGDDARIGAGAALHAHVVVSHGASVGAASELFDHVVLYDGVQVGARCTIHAGAVLGSDGFGFDPVLGAQGLERWSKVAHGGSVIVEDEVEIGANCAIDRGRFGATRIGRGSKLDNLVHVGHNVQIGEHVLLIAQVGVAGSTTIGRGAVLAGQTGVAPQLEIGAGARIGGGSAVFENVPAGEDWMGIWAQPKGRFLRQLAQLRRLGELEQRVKQLERALELRTGDAQ